MKFHLKPSSRFRVTDLFFKNFPLQITLGTSKLAQNRIRDCLKDKFKEKISYHEKVMYIITKFDNCLNNFLFEVHKKLYDKITLCYFEKVTLQLVHLGYGYFFEVKHNTIK